MLFLVMLASLAFHGEQVGTVRQNQNCQPVTIGREGSRETRSAYRCQQADGSWTLVSGNAEAVSPAERSIGRQPAPTLVHELYDEWDILSPRNECMGGHGYKDGKPVQMSPDEIARLRRSTPERRHSQGYTESYISYLSSDIAVFMLGDQPDRRRVETLVRQLEAFPLVPDTTNNLLAYVNRECTLAYVAATLGIGQTSVEERYRRSLAAWDARFSGFYDRDIVAMNYILTRQRLLQGDAPGAFAVSQDPVMTWAITNSGNQFDRTTSWVASFHILGIGTPVDPAKALAIFEPGHWASDTLDAAVLKTSMGRRDEAIAEVDSLIRTSWSGEYWQPRARALYQEISGRQFVESPSLASQAMIALLAIPVAYLSYCIENPGRCPSSGSAGQGVDSGPTYWEKREADCRSSFGRWTAGMGDAPLFC